MSVLIVKDIPDSFVGIPELIQDSLSSCDIDVRPHMLSNVIVTGGSSLFQNFTERLNTELYKYFPGVSSSNRHLKRLLM